MDRQRHEARIDHLLHELEGLGTRRVRLGGFDIDGVLRGKYVTFEKFASALQGSLGFCDVIFGWDSGDVLYDNTKVTGWHSGYPDLESTIDPSSFRRVPWENDIPFFLLDFRLPDGTPHPASPRQILQRVVGRAADLGFTASMAGEYEFFLFKEDCHSVRDKGYRHLTPLTPGMFGYSAIRASAFGPVLHELCDQLDAFGIEVEGIHTETGPGVFEAAIRYDGALEAADKAALFKTATKELLARHGVMATFMAKVSQDLPGCSGHVHQSLWQDGRPVFADPDAPDGLSKTFRHYIAGLVHLLPELMALFCPTINSYKRTVPGLWAPTTATWGFENRTAALRVIRGGSAKATRVENRLVGADMNPYLAFAASLGAGLWGIEHELELSDPLSGDAYAAKDARTLPRSLSDATDLLERSEAARALFGDGFVDHYVATRRWEVRQARAAVTDWELARYFEII